MKVVAITTKPKKFWEDREVTFKGPDEDIEIILAELKAFGPWSPKVKSRLNFAEIDAILQQINAER